VELLELVRCAAEDAGLYRIGVADAAAFPEVRAELERRVADGRSGLLRFTFADPKRSSDVRRSLPWARRLIVAVWAYLPDAGSPGPPRPGAGRVARFATEDHYRGLRAGLEAVAGVVRSAGWRAVTLADDNRLVDRAAAVRAGVGWWGKNAQVLTPGPGPWTLLGSVVTDAELPVSPAMRRDCGTCAACLPACPTGALIAPGILDARACLAHWAQAPGIIPRPLRRAMGDRLYGCDDCLEACPPGRRVLGAATAQAGRVDLIEMLGADDRTLRRRCAHWYVPRNDVRHLRRNALVALGNAGGRDAAAVAAGYAGHPDWLLRLHAVWALGELGQGTGRAALRAAARREAHPEVRAEIDSTLEGC
jgi:epoxyqueuosine reductase